MDKYINLLKELMLCKAVSNDIPAVNKSSEILLNFLTAEGLFCTVEQCDGRNVIFASTVPGRESDILLNAHIDVVPALSPDTYIPKIHGNTIKGRGCHDCLGSVVCIAKTLIDLKGKASVSAIFTCDEEIGGETTAAMVARGYRANKIAVVIDGSSRCVTIAQKGILILKLVARGSSGHASAPWSYQNAIERLMEGFARFKAAWPTVTADNQWQNTMTPCMVSAGHADNQIPDYAEMTINIRFIQDDDKERILEMAKNTTGLEVEISRLCYPLYSSEEEPMLKKMQQAIQDAYPDVKIPFTKMNGATDARHLRSMKVPVAIIGIPGGAAHSEDEWTEIDGIQKYAELLTKFALS